MRQTGRDVCAQPLGLRHADSAALNDRPLIARQARGGAAITSRPLAYWNVTTSVAPASGTGDIVSAASSKRLRCGRAQRAREQSRRRAGRPPAAISTFARRTNLRSCVASRAEQVGGHERVNGLVDLAEAHDRDDPALGRAAGRQLRAAVGEQAQVRRELALQELDRIGARQCAARRIRAAGQRARPVCFLRSWNGLIWRSATSDSRAVVHHRQDLADLLAAMHETARRAASRLPDAVRDRFRAGQREPRQRPPQPQPLPREIGGRDGPEPTRFGDWEKAGRCIDF